MTPEKIYVHYGCGQVSPKEWINFDASPTLQIQKTPVIGWILKRQLGQQFDPHVRFGDITKGLPGIKEGSADGVYCSHVLEHMSLEDFRKALTNTYKILKKGGRFRIILPDLEPLIRDYIADKEKNDPDASLTFISRTLMGSETRPRGIKNLGRHLFGYLKHLWLWDYESIEKELRKVGFSNIRKCEFNDSEDEMFKLVESEERFKLCVKYEAIK
jgi:predicted SAM-dependent methyltransferase